jgi:hypothetical protein
MVKSLEMRDVDFVEHSNKVGDVEGFSSMEMPVCLFDSDDISIIHGVVGSVARAKGHSFSAFLSWFYLSHFLLCEFYCCSSFFCFFGWCWQRWSLTVNGSGAGKQK